MKKLLMFVFCGLCILSVVGCSNTKSDNVLKLNHNVDLVELEPSKIIQEKQENLAVGNLPEVERKMYEKESYLDPIINYIKNTFNVDIDSRWEYVIHYYNEEKTDGMIQFTYMIGSEIRSNKNITFGYENGYIKDIYYKLLDKEIDEQDLIERVRKFKDKYTQEKLVLKKGETFYSEDTNYSYYYNVDKLVYSYAVFFKYDGGIINNDNGTSYFIDNNGDAIE